MIRRTVSMPDDLAREIERIAKREKRSFSGALAGLARDALRRRKRPVFRSLGAGTSKTGDLSLRTEEILREIYEEWKD